MLEAVAQVCCTPQPPHLQPSPQLASPWLLVMEDTVTPVIPCRIRSLLMAAACALYGVRMAMSLGSTVGSSVSCLVMRTCGYDGADGTRHRALSVPFFQETFLGP